MECIFFHGYAKRNITPKIVRCHLSLSLSHSLTLSYSVRISFTFWHRNVWTNYIYIYTIGWYGLFRCVCIITLRRETIHCFFFFPPNEEESKINYGNRYCKMCSHINEVCLVPQIIRCWLNIVDSHILYVLISNKTYTHTNKHTHTCSLWSVCRHTQLSQWKDCKCKWHDHIIFFQMKMHTHISTNEFTLGECKSAFSSLANAMLVTANFRVLAVKLKALLFVFGFLLALH